jgi:hypothetical protein
MKLINGNPDGINCFENGNGPSRCPLCNQPVDKFEAILSEFPGQTDAPEFWGDPGEERMIVHHQGFWCHFRVGDSHRLAYLDGGDVG